MPIDESEVRELMEFWPKTLRFEEGQRPYFLIPNMPLPDTCASRKVDVLLCAHERDGYPSRLFFSQVVSSPAGRNWNHTNVPIIGRVWHAFSWRVDPATTRLALIVRSFLRGLE